MVKNADFWRTRLSVPPQFGIPKFCYVLTFLYIYIYPENFMTVTSLNGKNLKFWRARLRENPIVSPQFLLSLVYF